jgi:hypothetical protein
MNVNAVRRESIADPDPFSNEEIDSQNRHRNGGDNFMAVGVRQARKPNRPEKQPTSCQRRDIAGVSI